MTTTTLQSPRLARKADQPSFWQRVWDALEAHGRRRAEAELHRIALLHVSTDPRLSRELHALARRTASH